jgi:hypothetical protein
MDTQTHTESTAMVPMAEVDKLRRELDAVRAKDMMRLGDGAAFWIQEAGQKKRGFKARVNLDFPAHFCFPGFGENAKPMITGEGYDRANQYANIEVFRPKFLMGQDGTERGNPYFERDPKNNSITSIFLRGLGIGYGPTGNLVAVDQTIFLNVTTLLVQEIQAKVKQHPFLGVLGTEADKPTQITYYGDNGQRGRKRVVDANPKTVDAVGCWHFIPHMNGLGYWVNVSHPYILEAFDSITQKQRYLERTAFTILKRLILSSHPAIGTKTPTVTQRTADEWGKVTAAKAHIVVYGFCAHEDDAKAKHRDMQAMAERVAKGEAAANMEVIQAAAVDGSEEEVDAAEFADPSEIPAEPAPEYYDDEVPPPPAAPVQTKVVEQEKPAEAPAPTNGNGNGNGLKTRLAAAMKDPTKKAAVMAAKSKLNFKTFDEIRNATPERMGEFLAEVGA